MVPRRLDSILDRLRYRYQFVFLVSGLLILFQWILYCLFLGKSQRQPESNLGLHVQIGFLEDSWLDWFTIMYGKLYPTQIEINLTLFQLDRLAFSKLGL